MNQLKLGKNSEKEITSGEEPLYMVETKQNISDAIRGELKKTGISMRELGRKIEMKHPQIVRVTGGNNYNVDTLLKVLDGLNLELIVQEKKTVIL